MISNITATNSTPNLYNVKITDNKNYAPVFKGLDEDKFEFSTKITPVKIQDISGNPIDAVIEEKNVSDKETIPDNKKFSLMVNGKELGYATVRDNDRQNALDLYSIYTEEYDNKNYKKAGTELLKQAVNESIKRGYNGRIETWASNKSYSPVGFYYKENFIVPPFSEYSTCIYTQRHNAAIEYSIANNIPVQNVLPYSYRKGQMKLDEQGAKALLDGKRLYEDRIFEKIEQKNINGTNYSANFIQSPLENEYFVFIANEDAEEDKAEFVVTLHEKENKNGQKQFVVCDMFNYNKENNDCKDFALEMTEKISREKGYEQPIITNELNNETNYLYANSNVILENEKPSFLKSVLDKFKKIL